MQVWVAPEWGGRSCVLRSNLIAVAREQDLTIREKPFTLVELYSASEMFVSNAVSGVAPVTEVWPQSHLLLLCSCCCNSASVDFNAQVRTLCMQLEPLLHDVQQF